MIQENQILAKLKTVDQYCFERLIDNLFHQGAFPEIADRNAFLESFGTNIEKERTIKSAPRADAEIISSGTKIEKSVDENWSAKFQKDIVKNKGKDIKRFVFCTNQDTSTKTIRVNRKAVDALTYCKEKLRCEECFIIGAKDLTTVLQNPDFVFIRRNFLGIPQDFFYSPPEFLQQIWTNPSLASTVPPDQLRQYSFEIDNSLTSSPGELIVLHADDYITLLHAIGIWAESKAIDQFIERDYCFINWPRVNADLSGVDYREIRNGIKSFVIVWGAHEIHNLSEYLKFNNSWTTMVFVTKSSFKDTLVRKRLLSFRSDLPIKEITIASIDRRPVTTDELQEHESRIRSIVQTVTERLKQLEALIYFYSPVLLTNEVKLKKMAQVLGTDEPEVRYFIDLLVEHDLAEVTGKVLWLKQPGVAKTLLNDFINKDIIRIEQL